MQVLSRGTLLLAALLSCTVVLLSHVPQSHAITSDYCGSSVANGWVCNEGSGYRGWRYHQSSRGALPDVSGGMCAYGYTGSGFRTGSGCGGAHIYYFGYCAVDPTTQSWAGWSGSGSSAVVYGHADSRTDYCSGKIAGTTQGLPAAIEERIRDVAPAANLATIRRIATGDNAAVFRISGADSCVVLLGDDYWSGTCSPNDELAATALTADGSYLTYGSAKGDAVRLVRDDGTTVTAAVNDRGGFLVNDERPIEVDRLADNEEALPIFSLR